MDINEIIGYGVITTNNSASSYGRPVLVVDGNAYGPDDIIDGCPAGSLVVTCDSMTMHRPDDALVSAACAWLAQSAANGRRWVDAVRRDIAAMDADNTPEHLIGF